MSAKTFNFYFKIYLIILFFFSTYFLIEKYNNPVEWTISDWLINYQGGFTRRGFIGEIIFHIGNTFSLSFRGTTLLFQILTYLFYYYLLFNFLKNTNKHVVLVFAIFSPLFILYPIAELEVLARKEIFIFISFILIANILSSENIQNKHYFYFSLILSICSLIWEGIIFYLPFFIFVLLIKNNLIFNKSIIANLILSLLPIILIFYFIIFFRLSNDELKIMCNSINECYGAMTYLNNDLQSIVTEVNSKFEAVYLVRYILIFLIGFFPLILMISRSRFNIKNKFKKEKYFFISFALIFSPSLIFYYIAQDWGRWINISYSLSLLTYIYCLKNNYIVINSNKLNFLILKKKVILIICFIIFSFGWNPKTLMSDDLGSIPIYRKSLSVINDIKRQW